MNGLYIQGKIDGVQFEIDLDKQDVIIESSEINKSVLVTSLKNAWVDDQLVPYAFPLLLIEHKGRQIFGSECGWMIEYNKEYFDGSTY